MALWIPELPEGYEYADDSDPLGGIICPHGEYLEPDSPVTVDGCTNPLMDMGLV